MTTTVSYVDPVIRAPAIGCGVGAVAGLAAVAWALLAPDPPFPMLIALALTVLCAATAIGFAVCAPATIEIDDIGLAKRQRIGAWRLSWEGIEQALVIRRHEPMLVLVPRSGPETRPMPEAWLRIHDLPLRARSLPLSAPVRAAVETHLRVPLTER